MARNVTDASGQFFVRRGLGIGSNAANRATAAANAVVTLTKSAVDLMAHVVSWITVSYSGTPTGGGITVQDGAGNTIFDADIANAGVTHFAWDPPLRGQVDTDLIVTLKAGGAGVVGKINIHCWEER